MPIHAPTGFKTAQQTVTDTALKLADLTDFNADDVDRAGALRLTVHNDSVRYRYDGTAPTTAVGHKLSSGGVLVLSGDNNIANFQIIRDSTTPAEVAITLEE
jgi:hypothetical protein